MQPRRTPRALMRHHSHARLKRMTLKTTSNQSGLLLSDSWKAFSSQSAGGNSYPAHLSAASKHSDLSKNILWSNRAARGPSPVSPSTRRRHLRARRHLICLIKLPFLSHRLFFPPPADVCLHTDGLFLTGETDVCWRRKQSFERAETCEKAPQKRAWI